MTDLSIRRLTPEILRQRGAEDYERGFGPGDHGLTDPEQIKHYEFDWHQRRVECSQMARAA